MTKKKAPDRIPYRVNVVPDATSVHLLFEHPFGINSFTLEPSEAQALISDIRKQLRKVGKEIANAVGTNDG